MSNLPANLQNLVTDLEKAKQATPADSGDFQFLKMDKSGTWLYGADDIEVDSQSEFIIDPATYAQGFIAWDDGELVDERMAVAGAEPITRTDLPDVGAEWNSQVGVALLGIGGDDNGEQLMYKTSSKGGRGAISDLIDEVIARAKSGEPDICPVVVLENEWYRHKKYGKIYKPVFNIVRWASADDVPDAEEPAPEAPEPEQEPEKKTKIKTRTRKRTTH